LKIFTSCRWSGLLVAVDDADLPLGEIRLRPERQQRRASRAGVHRAASGSREFARLRIGIGRRRMARGRSRIMCWAVCAARAALLEKVLDRAAGQVECWLDDGIEKAMNQFNGAASGRPHETKEKKVKRYEGLFILNTAGKEEGVKDALDKISAEITTAGGKVETVQKMDKKRLRAWRTRSTARRLLRERHFHRHAGDHRAVAPQVRAERGSFPRAVHAVAGAQTGEIIAQPRFDLWPASTKSS
jgi:hypothetical protein